LSWGKLEATSEYVRRVLSYMERSWRELVRAVEDKDEGKARSALTYIVGEAVAIIHAANRAAEEE